MSLPPASGTIAITNTSTPIPPIQWVKLLQNRRDLGHDSTSARILAPVVVNPDAVSKTASTIWGIYPEIRNGSAPKRLRINQESATITKPSLEYIRFFFGLKKTASIPKHRQINRVIRMLSPSFSLYMMAMIQGGIKNSASKLSTQPRQYNMIPIFIIFSSPSTHMKSRFRSLSERYH